MQDNFLDVVLIKAKDSLPTYHLAHLVDDYLMGTTHIIRSDEWLASLPLHLQLFSLLGVKPLQYAHVSPLLKLDDGKKRKLSKRKDPEANIEWFFEQGYPVDAIIEFLMNIIDPSFEERQKNNPEKKYTDFVFQLSHMNESGALFDLVKLDFVSKEWIAKLDKKLFVEKCLEWAHKYSPELHEKMVNNQEYTFKALNIERCTELDPKRFTKFSDIVEQLPNFYDEVYEANYENKPELPENVTQEIINKFVSVYLEKMDLHLEKDAWFEQFKEIAANLGDGMNFAGNNKEFKE